MKRTRKLMMAIVAISIVLGCAVGAFASNGSITKELFYRDIKITLNGQKITPTYPDGSVAEPFIIDGVTYLPVRGISSVLGLDVDWDGGTSTVILTQPKTSGPNQSGTYGIGDTWTVDGQWSLTITGVTETKDRNQFSEKNPGAVYIVDYTYTNIGYSRYNDGLYFSVDDTIVDCAGIMGYGYPGNIVNYPKETPIGATCNAQACIGVDNPGDFLLYVSKYDNNGEKQSATFEVNVD